MEMQAWMDGASQLLFIICKMDATVASRRVDGSHCTENKLKKRQNTGNKSQ